VHHAVTFRLAFVKLILRPRLIVFFCGLLVFASSAFGQGEYQQTRNSKTMFWNWTPKPGETSSWAGDRDKENYASGFGDLTWYDAKGKVYAFYYGNMVHGKFEGPVNVHSKGRTAHAYFADGGRVTGWARGPAPSRMNVPEQAITARRKAKAENVAEQKRLTAPTPEPAKKTKSERQRKPEDRDQRTEISSLEKPAPEAVKKESPPAVAEKQSEAPRTARPARAFAEPTAIPAKSETGSQKPEVSGPTESAAPALDGRAIESAQPSIQETPPVAEESATERKAEITGRTSEIPPESAPPPANKESPADVSLNALVGPPSSLRSTSIPETSSEKSEKRSSSVENGPLTEAEAISLADTETRAQGLPLDNYERPKADHSQVKGRWSLFYDLKKTETGSDLPAGITVTVEDESRKVEIRK
jgi:hypothetical protein